ncbi:MAG: MerR family transcriptional regulator [Nitrospirota bacterium]|nr:MerR family transcriptional regulator [Nitrospirota bacterium]
MEDGFSSSQAIALTGVSRRQLVYWRQTELIEPSVTTAGGHARYTFRDLIALRTAKRLIDAGVSLQRIRSSITSLIRFLPDVGRPLEEVSLVATGDVVLVFHGGAAFEALSGQEWVFPVAELARDVERLRRKEAADPVQEELFPGWSDDGEAPASGSGAAA